MKQRVGADNEIRKKSLGVASLGLTTARCETRKSHAGFTPEMMIKVEINIHRGAAQESI
jgi:hypothetical protein